MSRLASAPRLAWAFPVAFLCLMIPARTAVAFGLGNGAAGAVAAVALFALPLLYTIPRGRAVWDRWPGWLLAAQAVLTYLPFLMFGQKWAVGLSGLLGGLLLLTLPARVRWPLFGAVVAAEGVLRLAILGVYPTGDAQFISIVFVVPIDMALPLFGLVRLSDLVSELRAARIELAELAVARERRRAGARLRSAIDGRLEEVVARAGAALAVLSARPDQARARLSEAAGIARQAAEQVRATVVADPRDVGRGAPRRTGNAVARRLALLVLLVTLAVIAGHNMVIVADVSTSTAARAVGWAAIAAIVAAQVHHSLGVRGGVRPRGWRATLAVQVVMLVVLVAATAGDPGNSATGMAAFPAGSALLLLMGWRAWLGFAALSAGVGVHWVVLFPQPDTAVYLAGLAAAIGLAVYGLSRLTGLAEELEGARRELARAAVERERLRVTQDTHDLLGMGLAAVALKSDLAGRLIGRDDSRARAELDALVELCGRTRAEIRAVTTGGHGLSLHTEFAAAREVLASAGVAVELRAEPPRWPLPGEVDTILATVLREAVTNVLRHATAARCEITLTVAETAVSLEIANDGVANDGVANDGAGDPPDPAPGRPPAPVTGGHGLANLAARVEALRGQLTARGEGGRFTLIARIPVSTASASDG